MQPTSSAETRPWKSTYVTGMRAYFTFNGRASRKEFWGLMTALIALGFVAGMIDTSREDATDGLGTLSTVLLLVHAVPFMALSARRMHDLDRTGWWALLNLTLVGAIVLLFVANGTGTRGPNRFGPAPDGSMAAGPGTEAPQHPPRDPIAEIERLAQLRANGSLSETEYEVMKAQAMAGSRPRA